MTRDDLDRLLADEEHLQPSSGFAASVMSEVHRESSAPPALPFPWSRALPGFLALAVALVVAVWSSTVVLTGAGGDGLSRVPADLLMIAQKPEIGWALLAVIMTIVPALLSLQLTRPRM